MKNTNKPKPFSDQEFQELRSKLAAAELISERHVTALIKSEERFSLAMQGANDGLWDWDFETDKVYYSPRWKSMLGYEADELGSTLDTWASLVHADDKDRVLGKVEDYIAGRVDSFEAEMRMSHKLGHEIVVLARGLLSIRESDGKPIRLVGTHLDITERKEVEAFNLRQNEILMMIAIGRSASEVYDAIALLYESRHPGLRCSMLELHGNKLMHGGAPSLPKEYCEAVNGLEYGPNVGSCGTSTYTGKRVLVENIETDPKWEKIKHVAMPHGMRSCWSEPIKSSFGKVLGAFGMYYNHPALPNQQESDDLLSAAMLASIVMERDQDQKRIHTLAYADGLTGLASRAHLYENLEELIKISSRHHRRFGLLYIDLDDFKGVNDSLGHDAGDILLKAIAERLEGTSREVDFVARLGGDEFCIVAKEIDDDYGVVNVAQRCLDAIADSIELKGRKYIPGCSIGIAQYPDDGKDLTSLIKAADTALYEAKGNGKNQYAFYESELTMEVDYRFQVEHYLREAIEEQQLSLVYQPQIDTHTGQIVGVEALCRWNHSVLGQVPPLDFIPIAERIGMMKPLTEWVLRTACKQASAWSEEGYDVRMAVNVSPSHFLDEDIIALIKSVTEDALMDKSKLELEVTESVVQTDPRNISIFQALKALGVQLAIDDFGTGYSSIASLKHLNVDCLKIDKYFVDDMLMDKSSEILVETMIEMGHKLGYGIVAEGVETSEQLNALKSLGCETAQGYLFSKPVSSNEILKLLSSGLRHC